MSLLLAVGQSSISSRLLWKDDNVTQSETASSLVAVTVSSDQTLRAVVTFKTNKLEEHADLRVMILPAAEPLTDLYPETAFQIRLPSALEDKNQNEDHGSQSIPDSFINGGSKSELFPDKLQVSALFSADKKFLVCLVPCSHSRNGTIVVLELVHTSTTSRSKGRPPPPAYVHATTHRMDFSLVPVAANARVIVSGWIQESFYQISSIEDLPIPSTPHNGRSQSILLAGCRDGSILAVSYRPLSMSGVLWKPPKDLKATRSSNDIRQIKHWIEAEDAVDGLKGKLAVIYADGSLGIFSLQLNLDTFAPHKTNGDIGAAGQAAASPLITMQPHYRVTGQAFLCSEWLCGSHLALMRHEDGKCVVEAYAIGPEGALLISTWDLSADRLLEDCHRRFTVDQIPKDESDSSMLVRRGREVALQYHRTSDCLAITGTVATKKILGELSFACIWNWRSNVEGLLVAAADASSTPGASLSLLNICSDAAGATKLAHATASCQRTSARIRLELYDSAILAPRSDYPPTNGNLGLRTRSNLLLSPSTVSYPHLSRASAKSTFELEWRESAVSWEYIQTHGPLDIATIGRHRGSSIAVASAHGLCTMDCTNIDHSGTRTQRRWRRFGKAAEEAAFKVLAFVWWEGPPVQTDEHYLLSEDLILAIVEVSAGDESGRYLSCWSPRMLDLDHQLLFPAQGARKHRWGIDLPEDFNASSLDVLECLRYDGPEGCQSRKAILLISDDLLAASYRIFQVQLVNEPLVSHDELKDSLPFFVLAECAASNIIGSSADLFLAAGNFGFDLRDAVSSSNATDFVATLAVIHLAGNGVDAICVSATSIIAAGQLVDARQNSSVYEISAVWQADVVRKRLDDVTCCDIDLIVWLFKLADDSFMSWSVPSPNSADEITALLAPKDRTKASPFSVHFGCHMLGYYSHAANSSLWIHQPSIGPGKHLLLQTTPRSTFGCILSSGQDIQKFHRTLGEDFEHDLFRVDFLEHETLGPGDLRLSFPASIPSIYFEIRGSTNISNLESTFRHLEARIDASLFRDVSFLSLQLLISRLIEEIGALSSSRKSHRLSSRVFSALVHFGRLHMSPLQFSALFLETGRQLEPCYFDLLFPLPKPPVEFEDDRERSETVLDLFDLALGCGSIKIAASLLPLLHDTDASRRTCALILSHCLKCIDACCDTYFDVGFDVAQEEQAAIGDVFRYSLKLEDACISDTFDDSDASDEDGHSPIALSRYSILCGVLGRAQAHGFKKHMNGDLGKAQPDNGARITTQYLIQCLLHRQQWKKAIAIAELTIGGSTSGLTMCSKSDLTKLFHNVNVHHVLYSLPAEFRGPSGLVNYLTTAMQSCELLNSADKASRLVDYVLTLLHQHERLASAEVAGLLAVALVTSYAAGRTQDILVEDGLEEKCALVDAFYEAVCIVGV
jgi:hypothetical protein